MILIWVGLGGALGSIARYELGRRMAHKTTSAFLTATMLINASGALMLGIVMGFGVSPSATAFLATGFLGAYTTFSTFLNESFQLLQSGHRYKSIGYMVSMLCIGLGGFALGYFCIVSVRLQ